MKTRDYATVATAALAAGLAAAQAHAQSTPSAEGARVYFVNLEDGQTVSSPVTIIFGLDGMGVAPAGVEVDNTGHHHLLVNIAISDEMLANALPADDNHRHFGGGQTQVTLDLPAGEHTLQLLLADWSHIPHVPPVYSEQITITVE